MIGSDYLGTENASVIGEAVRVYRCVKVIGKMRIMNNVVVGANTIVDRCFS